ncbi:leucine-rich repeat receptor-like serine/threonine-protein kinase BAM2 [Abrus precatorius]|uniref:Leucine-rich repeat receptor-like serine/threonine-protein kinase BAM2 n=1 Tax=Abrus precatorius TaxID=3816 RepID=A0A8B8KPU1_ABRPR|nr:leucine-rich repeat receptor-like serine/threonine-protein kinase BAM2 [Abrus precatorius]
MATPHSALLLFHLLLMLILPSPSLQQPSHQKMHPFDLNALLSIKTTLTELSLSKHFFSTWNLTAPDPCSSFAGVTCSLNRVCILSLGTNSLPLAGSLPSSIASLTELTQLILYPGIVTGPIPPQLAQLTKLRVISLPSNRFTGTIPSTFSSLQNLHTLDLSHNQLAGSIPPSLTELPQLKVLILASNSLTGALPRTISSPLLHFDLKDNQLTGPLPPSLPSSLRYLSLSQNRMWGPLTNGLKSLSELVFLDLSMNRFSGPIPAQLFFMPALSSLFLQRNNLSGGLPRGPRPGPIDSYGEGSIVDLSHNALSGELSTVLDGVETLFLNNNRLMGSVPEAYVKSVCRGSTRTLYLQHNYFTGIPLQGGTPLPDTASLCLSYNCMVPPATLMTCPASAGGQMSRPEAQCSVFNHGRNKD